MTLKAPHDWNVTKNQTNPIVGTVIIVDADPDTDVDDRVNGKGWYLVKGFAKLKESLHTKFVEKFYDLAVAFPKTSIYIDTTADGDDPYSSLVVIRKEEHRCVRTIVHVL